MKDKRWRIPDPPSGTAEELSRILGCSTLLATLLERRDVRDAEGAERFLHPKLTHLHDPFELPDMEKAVERIERAVTLREPIAIFGDYDVDGVSATCLLHDFFRFIGYPVAYRLPNRLLDGYGLKCESVRRLAAEGIRLIITVDNGSSACEEADLAALLGVDLVITDHHRVPPVPPRAAALVNPWAPGSRYPFKGLAGVGVAFKLIWALSQRFSKGMKLSDELRGFLLESLALVALGTISDVVPLLGENRILAKFGLLALQRTSRPGLRCLVDSVLNERKETKLDAGHVGFRLGPRINAAGRLGRVENAIGLLLSTGGPEAQDFACSLETENRRRKDIEREMLTVARGLVEKEVDLATARVIVLASRDWHAGVIGIVASRIAEEYFRPTLLLALDGERARGSARSIPGVHICDALAACSEHLIGYGGHEMAAGVEMDPGLIADLRAALNGAISLEPSCMVPEIAVDAEVRLPDITLETLAELEALAPHGQSNPLPLLAVHDAAVVGRPRILGSDGRHLSFHVKQDGTALRAVAFGMADSLGLVEAPGAHVSILFEPKISRWQGRSTVELGVREIRARAKVR